MKVDQMGDTPAASLEGGRVYVKGNIHTLHEALKKMTGKESYSCAYFGDSISSDIVPCKTAGLFHPIAVVEEMESETDDIVIKEKLTFSTSPTAGPWGSIFADQSKGEDGAKVAEKTVLTHLIEQNALVCIPSVEVLPKTYKDALPIQTFNNDDPAKGWFPGPPEALLK